MEARILALEEADKRREKEMAKEREEKTALKTKTQHLAEQLLAVLERVEKLENKKDAALERVAKLVKRVQELTPPDVELVFSWARGWRALIGCGGLIGPGLGLGAMLSKDTLMASKMASASGSFLVFSATCLIATAFGNVRNIGTSVEKALVSLCGLLVGAAFYLPGYTFAGSEDEHTTYWGWLVMGLGAFFSFIMPPIACKGVSMWSQLEDHELSIAVIRLFKSLPSALPPMVYLAVASMRCIVGADDESPLYQQCGNPIVPSLAVNVLLIVVWTLSYIIAPLMKETKAKTWVDIMALRMGKIEAVEFNLLGLMSTFAWMLFATTNEDGEPMNLFMYSLTWLFLYFFFSLAFVVIFDVVIKPILFPSSTTASDDSADTDAESDDVNSSSSSTTTAKTTTATTSLSNADARGGSFDLNKMDAGLSGVT
mmetsp:Transcript_29589/g.58930  ORF Transcript_29589/g.58930 Transcript_29589/m.58930 type:complete len:428 (+) Transcript_29589:156-1439(+)